MVKDCKLEIRKRFPAVSLLRALSFYDARYWRSDACSLEDFRRKLVVLCEHYADDGKNGIVLDKEKLLAESQAAFGILRTVYKNALRQRGDNADRDGSEDSSVSDASCSDITTCSDDDDDDDDAALGEQAGLPAREGCHPNVVMWTRVSQLPAAQELYGETMRAAQMGMTMVGTSVMDERAFSAMTFIKNRLRSSLSKNLQLCMRTKLQRHFDLDSFPYHEYFV